MLRRRDFMGALAAAAGAFASGCATCGRGGGLRLACQMWSIEKIWKKDLSGAFAKLRAMGYEGVQSLAFFDLDRAVLEKALRDNGLVVVDMPFRRAMMAPERINSYLEFCDQFGIRFVYDPWEGCKTADDWKRVADELAELGGRLASRGLRVGYHNHRQELETRFADGRTPMDILADRGLPFELDVGHVKLGGGDPVAWLKRLSGRVPSIHAKPGGGNFTGCAEDGNDWAAILPAAASAGVAWAVVECEERRDTFADVDASARFLRPRI